MMSAVYRVVHSFRSAAAAAARALAHTLVTMRTRLQHESHVERLIYFACDTDDIIRCFINYQYTVTTVYAARVIIYIIFVVCMRKLRAAQFPHVII